LNQLTLPLQSQPAATLANYVVGENQSTLLQLRALVNGDRSQRFIYLWGPHGCGRTHLLQACQAGSQILTFDDCQRFSDEQARDAFVAFTQALSDPAQALVLAGDRPATQLQLRADLQSRIVQCLSFELKRLSDADLRLALAVAIAERGIHTAPEILNYLLNRLPRNMTTLRAALDLLDHTSLERKSPISLAMARELFGSFGSPGTHGD
jgi:DnaA-homolog protein